MTQTGQTGGGRADYGGRADGRADERTGADNGQTGGRADGWTTDFRR